MQFMCVYILEKLAVEVVRDYDQLLEYILLYWVLFIRIKAQEIDVYNNNI